jgi:predicted RNA binding protein YcfA (HicA-like mRNA interferase family)
MRVYNTHMQSSDLIKKMQKAGWVLRSTKGSHHIFTHPDRPGHVTVPHPKKDLGTGLLHKLLKQINVTP